MSEITDGSDEDIRLKKRKENMRVTKGKTDFSLSDVAQQVVGGALLAGPFVLTEEVWTLAGNMGSLNTVVTVFVVAVVGYGALYEADTDRDADEEQEIAGIPVRFVFLMLVAFGSVTVLAFLFGAPQTFVSEEGAVKTTAVTFKAVSVGAVFSVVGAATADTVF